MKRPRESIHMSKFPRMRANASLCSALSGASASCAREYQRDINAAKRRHPREEWLGGRGFNTGIFARRSPARSQRFHQGRSRFRETLARCARSSALITRVEFSAQLMPIISRSAEEEGGGARGMIKNNTSQSAGLRPSGEKLISLHQFRRVYAVGSRITRARSD